MLNTPPIAPLPHLALCGPRRSSMRTTFVLLSEQGQPGFLGLRRWQQHHQLKQVDGWFHRRARAALLSLGLPD